MAERYIGLMSGTSLDGVDGVLAEISAGSVRVLQHAYRPLPAALAAELLQLNSPGGTDELHRAALAANALALQYAEVVQTLLQATGTPAAQVRAIGAHGQTVRHRPGAFDGVGYTVQLNQPALLAERTGITVVADWRSRDLAAGGQGAPLVPAFHRAVFGPLGPEVAVLNIGGIANLTLLQPQRTLGWDCGPGNVLLDHWCRLHTGQAYDAEGRWAAGGQVDATLLAALLQEPYFSQLPPKSTGRDLFHPEWLVRRLQQCPPVAAADVQTTLCELTAAVCAQDLLVHAPDCRQLYVCGGGALNAELLRRLQARLPQVQVQRTDAVGLPATQVEATAFAWLARQTLHGATGNLAEVTGARGNRVLGAIYPA
jgi:anhydro-N-acetylmuramic acid kinase